MKKDHPKPRKKTVPPRSRVVPVPVRMERKKQYLIDVLDGRTVPDDFDNLRSLTLVRDWEDPGRGILKVGNTNSFTTTHVTYGSIVSDIQSLIQEINTKYPKKKVRSKEKPLYVVADELKDRADLAEEKREIALELWTQAQILIEELQSKIRLLSEKLAFSENLNAERAAEISKLRSERSNGPFHVV